MTQPSDEELAISFLVPSVACDKFWLGLGPTRARLTFGELGPHGPLVRVSVSLSLADLVEMNRLISDLVSEFQAKGGGKQ